MTLAPTPTEERTGGRAPAGAAPRWFPIRALGARHRDRVLEHLLALPPADRVLRFGHAASDELLRRYATQIDFDRDPAFGVFDRRLQLVAFAHLAFDSQSELEGGAAELGVSVAPHLRGHGLGSRLFDHAVVIARNRGLRHLLIHLLRENQAMLAIVRRAGASIRFDGGDATAALALPADTLGSQIEELLGQRAAELDYRLKLQVFRLDGLRPAWQRDADIDRDPGEPPSVN